MAFSSTNRLSPSSAVIAALGLYLAWTIATWMLEGRVDTLRRPNAVLDRLVYAVIANILIGIVGATWLVRVAAVAGVTSTAQTGFTSVRRSLLSVAAGLVFGLGALRLADVPADDPVVLLNAFAQVLVVSAAEILVCWTLVGGIVESFLGRVLGRVSALAIAILTSSALFGLYHFAHSPPFDDVGMVVFLTAISLVTGVFFVTSRNVYGAIVFHNFLGVIGVTNALAARNELESLAEPQLSLLSTALATAAVLVVADVLLIRRATGR